MKICKKTSVLAILTLALAAVLLIAPSVYAAAPTLTLASASDGDSVQLTAAGANDASVVFYYYKTGTGLQMSYLGKTNSSGNFTTNLSAAAYGISGDTKVYVTVNGLKSNEEAWPYLAAESVLSLSQTSVILPLGQTAGLTVYNNGTNFVYLSSNSNPPVVNVNIEGNKVNLKALNFGSTVVTICAGTGTPSCASAYVTVQNTGGTAIAFSQNNPTVAANKKIEISIIGGTGAYILLNNVNANTVQASLSASTLTLSTTATTGSSAITICSSDMSSCGIINAMVGNVSSTGLTFSLTNPTMTIGQNLSVPISGGTGGSYSIFSNSDADVVTASVSDTNLILVAKKGGVATVIVCTALGNCAPEVITVSYNINTGGSLKLSQNNLWLKAGESASITVTGGNIPYSAVGYSESILKASFTNNILNLTGVSGGSATVNVCSNGGCVGLAVLVSGSGSSETSSTLSLSQTSLALKAGGSVTVSISGNGNYFIAYNTNSTVAMATISGSVISVNALVTGATDVSVCQNGGQCAVLKITVSGDTAALSLSQTSLALSVGGTGKIIITGAGGYSIYSNTNSGVASATVSGSTATVTALAVGNTNLSICQSDGKCATVAVAVKAAEQVAGEKISGESTDWVFCANEKQVCSFTGYQTVRYGANGKYVYGSYLNGVGCTNSVLGDPIENVVKQCYSGGVIPSENDASGSVAGETASNTDGWTACAEEKQACKFSGVKTVRYGANGKYYYGIYSGSVSCLNSVFGDPIQNTAKQCAYGGAIPANAPTAAYKFKNALAYGSSGNEVKELQKKLIAGGFYADAIDGKFLTSTVAAVKKFQKSRGIKQTGNVGALTLAALNK